MNSEPLVFFGFLRDSFFLGALLGVGKDFLRFLLSIVSYIGDKRNRVGSRATAIGQFLQDILFCFATGFFLAVLLFYDNDGRLRALSVASVLIGFFLYRCSLGRLFIRFCFPWARKLGCGIYRALCCLFTPFVFCVRIMIKPILGIKKRCVERKRKAYERKQLDQLRMLSKKGFVNI